MPTGAARLVPREPLMAECANKLPLDGVRVVEFTHMVMGPS